MNWNSGGKESGLKLDSYPNAEESQERNKNEIASWEMEKDDEI